MTTTASDAVATFVAERGGSVSFAELVTFGDEIDLPGSGDVELFFEEDPNIVLWSHLSDALADAVTEARQQGRVVMRPTRALVYLVDGRLLRYPRALRPPAGGYRKKHWLPVVFDPQPVAVR